MSMHNPAMYEKFIAFQKRDALNLLKAFGSKMKWKNNASVIDLGSGDGYVTCNVLKKQLPPDFKRLVGVDISREMVDYANKKYGDDRTKFTIVDLGGKVPKELEGGFDHAFSSYAIQFVPNQEKTFSNIHSVLKDGGNCLLLFLGKTVLYNVYIALAQSEKWRPWMEKELGNIVSRYSKMEDATASGEIQRLMEENGFNDIYVANENTFFDYESLGHLSSMIESANLFHLPADKLPDFMKDFNKVFLDLKKLENVEGKPEAIRLRYNKLVAYGNK